MLIKRCFYEGIFFLSVKIDPKISKKPENPPEKEKRRILKIVDVVYLCKKRFKIQISVNFSIIRSIYCWYYSKSKLLCKLKISNMSTNGMSHSELAAFIYSFMSSTCIIYNHIIGLGTTRSLYKCTAFGIWAGSLLV